MKTKLMAAFLLIATVAGAQNLKFEKATEMNLQKLELANETADYQSVTNSFERIADAEPRLWLAQYYAGYSNLINGMQQETSEKKDEYYDRALKYIAKADSLQPDNSEIHVLKSWALGMKISIDPMNRGRILGPESGMHSSRAVELDPENPRAYYLMGQSAMYTPEQFGGGKARALPLLEKAVEKFEVFKPASPVMPNWGEKQAKTALEQCKKM